MTDIHPTALVDKKAELGEEVQIGAYSVIGPNVKIGSRCKIGPHVVIEGNTTLGEENQIFQFASLGAQPQDLKYHGEPSTLVIGSRNTIRECVTLHVGTESGRMTTVVGDSNLFMGTAHVAHDCRVGNNNVFANSVALAGHVTVGDNVILGGLVGVHQFVRVGDYALLGAGSMVGLDIPPYCIGQGDRCRLRGVNVIGLQRAGIDRKEISKVKKTYRLLFSTVGHFKQKMDELPSDLTEQPLVRNLLEFIENTQRGISSAMRSIADR